MSTELQETGSGPWSCWFHKYLTEVTSLKPDVMQLQSKSDFLMWTQVTESFLKVPNQNRRRHWVSVTAGVHLPSYTLSTRNLRRSAEGLTDSEQNNLVKSRLLALSCANIFSSSKIGQISSLNPIQTQVKMMMISSLLLGAFLPLWSVHVSCSSDSLLFHR